MLNIVFGILRGVIYFYLVKNIYRKADESDVKQPCQNGFDNYKCNEIYH